MKTHINKLLGSLVLAATLSATGAAHAIAIVNTWNPADITIAPASITTPISPTTTIFTSYTFTHNITDNGFVVGTDTLVSATLSILLKDDGGAETFSFNLGPVASPVQTVFDNNVSSSKTYAITLTNPSLADLRSDGIISVTIQSISGSFIFDQSTLTAQVTKPVSPSAVPEPASLALLGIGLVGLAAMRRRKTA